MNYLATIKEGDDTMINLCAGPTIIEPEVKKAFSTFLTNPDMDPNYTKIHRETEQMISKLVHTDATSFLMLGEGIMGLEAACASLVEKDDRVLVLSNGVFGRGFGDFVKNYGGEVVLYEEDLRRGIEVEKLEEFLKKDHDFKLATLVHCETPSGITNDISTICPLLEKYGILSIVDSVSGMGGEEVHFDQDKIDVLLGGSQKCISAPTGLTLVTLSEKAKQKIDERLTPIPSYYLNFKNYYAYSDQFDFPYTMCENLTYALHKALELILEKDFINLHQKAANVIRKTLTDSNLELFPLDSFSNTVTTVICPSFISKDELIQKLYEKEILISGGIGEELKDTFRIAHMGSSIKDEYFCILFKSLDEIFEEYIEESHLLDNYQKNKESFSGIINER